MSKNSVVKKFDALVSKYGFDRHDLVDMYEIDEEMNIIERTLFLIPDAHIERRARKDFENEEGDLSAYGVVVVKCAYLMRWCLECFHSAETVLAGQQADSNTRLRKCSLAYEVYWHLNSDFLLRSVMNKVLESSILDSSFFRHAHTFQHPDLDNVGYHQMLKVVSEIVMLHFQYNGQLLKMNKTGLKPSLLATKASSQGWKLPSQSKSLSLKNDDELQLIRGNKLSIVLCYDVASLVLGGGPAEIKGGQISVFYQDQAIYAGEHSFAIDLDSNNAYTAMVDRWHQGGSRWVSEVLLQETKHRSLVAHAEEIEALIFEACTNLLNIALNNGSGQSLEIHEHLYCRELSWYAFNDYLFGQLRPEFLTPNLCAQAVSRNYDCLAFLPEHARKNLRIGLAALRGDCIDRESIVWGLIFSHTEMPLDALAKAYIQAEGSKCYANLPLRLKTMELLHYTLEKDPDCLNYTTNPSVLANREEFDAFLEHQMPGLAKLVQTIMATTNFSPRQAYESALATQALTVTSEQLPTFDFSDFGIPA